MKDLRVLGYKIEHTMWLEDNTEQEDQPILVFGKKEFIKKRDHIRESVVGLLQNVKIIYKCGNFAEIYEKTDEKYRDDVALCDRNTISILLGGSILEFFFKFRPVVYCDRFLKKRYFSEGNLSGYVGMFESLSMYHLERDMRKSDVVFNVFRKDDDRNKALKEKKLSEKDGNYALMRLTDKRCKLYPSKTSD